MNHVAKPYLPNPGGLVYDTPITEVLPAFEAVHDVLATGEEIIQETGSINGADILYDMIPLTYKNGEILGAVITFNDAGTITRGEHKIRDKGIKGFQATYSFKDICGSSQQMNQCIQHAKRYAHTDLTVLLCIPRIRAASVLLPPACSIAWAKHASVISLLIFS